MERMLPQNGAIRFEQKPEWLKVTLPDQRNWLLFGSLTVCLVVWTVALVWIISFLVTERPLNLVLLVLLLLWLAIWFWFGRKLWNMWQYHAANREILFINEKQLIVRRPVSILGPTDTYDMRHVTPFYYSEKHGCPAFDYAYQHVYFGQRLAPAQARELVTTLNNTFFPDAGDDD
jgi:hypothetical protein